MRANSKTLSKPTSNVIDRTFLGRQSRRRAESQAQMMIEADQRENTLLEFFRGLPADKQRDVLAIDEVYYREHGTDA